MPSLQAIDARASSLMHRGIWLMNDGRIDSIVAAAACFDDALELRRRLPIDVVPSFRYGLAACWLNRAEALMRLGGPPRIALAVRSFDEAIVLLRTLRRHDDVRFPRRLAIALQNRGLALETAATGREAAIDAFTQAIAVLECDASDTIPDRDCLLAAVLANLANAYASENLDRSDALACRAARRALALLANLERHTVDAAAVALTARHVICRTLARRLSHSASPTRLSDDVHEATDLADEGLELVRRWEHSDVTAFRHIPLDLFRFGAAVYQRYQPQFLTEFLFENQGCVSIASE